MYRCYNTERWNYADYGGRGIKVCSRWHDYENFLADMGPVPEGLTLERINTDKGYSPKNCKWATRKEQQLNRRGYNKDRCIRGHSLSGWNLSMTKGYKVCVTCRRLMAKKRRAAKAEAL